MVRALVGLVVPLLSAGTLSARQAPATPSCGELPAGPAQPPNVTASVRGEFLKAGKTLIQDIYLSSPDGSRTRAFLIKPSKAAAGGGGAAFFLHWLGGPPANDRAEFFEDAVQLAENDVTSLLVDAPWAEPEWFPSRKLDEDLANVTRYAAQLQAYFRYLVTQASPSPDRVAFIGHDFGAMYGALLMQREPAIRHAVVMAAVGDFGDWFVLGRKLTQADSIQYRQRMAAVAPSRYLRCIGKADVLFQFAENDRFVSRAQAAVLIDNAPAEKSVLWYAGGHELQDASRKDRLDWLIKRIGTGNRN
jgi:predicted esterase